VLQKQHTLKVQKNGKDIHIFPSESEYNHIILQVKLYAFPYRPMRSTKNCPAIDRPVAIDALDMPGLETVGSSTSHNPMDLHDLFQG
jgi:hypothetical protein